MYQTKQKTDSRDIEASRGGPALGKTNVPKIKPRTRSSLEEGQLSTDLLLSCFAKEMHPKSITDGLGGS